VYEKVRQTRAVDALGMADVRTHATVADTADERTATQRAVQATPSPGRLSHATGRIARTQVRDGTDGAVLEAAEQSVTEVDVFCLCFYVLGRCYRRCTRTQLDTLTQTPDIMRPSA